MIEEIEKFLNSKNLEDQKLGLNLITYESIRFLNPEKLAALLYKHRELYISFDELCEFKRIFSSVKYDFSIFKWLFNE